MNLARHNGATMLRMRIIPNIAIHRRAGHDTLMHLPPQEAAVPEMMFPGHIVRVVSRADLVHGRLHGSRRVLEKGGVDLLVEFFDQLVVVAFGD